MTDASGDEPTPSDALVARIAELESEVDRLTRASEVVPPGPHVERTAGPRRGRWRTVVSVLCIVLASVLVPVSVVGAWARTELVEPDQFVSTFGPLVHDPAVQTLVIDQATSAILDEVDVGKITDDLFDGLAGLDLPPRSSAALEMLREPAADGVRSLVERAVTRLVTSDAFAEVWDRALRVTHRAVVASATGDPSGVVSVDGDGVVGIELGPVIAEVKARLADQGVGFASAIPEISRTIVIAQSDALVTVRVVYGIAVTVGTWLPVVTLLLFVGGTVVARRRGVALLGAGLGLALGSAALVVGFSLGDSVIAATTGASGVSVAALAAIYEQVVDTMRQTAIVGTVLGAVVVAVAWLNGRSPAAVAVRSGVSAADETFREALAGRGVSTGRFGVFVDRRRSLVRTVLVAAAVLWLWSIRPLDVAEIVMVLVITTLVWWVCDLARPPSPAADAPPGEVRRS